VAAAEGAAVALALIAAASAGTDARRWRHSKKGRRAMTQPLLHLVFGGEVRDPQGLDFVATKDLDIVGIYPSYAEAYKAWRGASQRHVDHANIKYVVVHLHRLLDPSKHGDQPIGDA
jgi:hypothetical protein